MADERINFEQYDVAVPWADIPVEDTVEEGRYVLRVREFKLYGSRGSDKLPADTLCAAGYFVIDEGPLTGVYFPIVNFTLGTAEDPLCNRDPNTWKTSRGGKQLNRCLDACGTRKDTRSLQTTLRLAQGARFQAYVTKTLQKDGAYAGTEQNNITKYAPYGQEMKVPGRPNAGQGTSNGPSVPRTRMRPTFDRTDAQAIFDNLPHTDGAVEDENGDIPQ